MHASTFFSILAALAGLGFAIPISTRNGEHQAPTVEAQVITSAGLDPNIISIFLDAKINQLTLCPEDSGNT
ncbi:hypothetical protein G7Y89_g14817 [Cudoniella acicularis]|uniref:Uncharacterized protein n=1 Tax=Cudoniella acicularis TaxID=354080 RepID=A0A8H4QY90_9HELO|nr:hypothetical protein G7Y89_g14817 [Cudoniella acicularis]